jgi:hypothetical protein
MLNFDKHFSKGILMRQVEVFNKIGGIIKEINDQYKYLEADLQNMNELEWELFVANTHFLVDHAEILSKLNKSKPANVPEKKEITGEKFFEPVVQPLMTKDKPAEEAPATPVATEEELSGGIDLSTAAPEDTYSYIREEPEVIKHELIIDESEVWDDEDEAPVIGHEPVKTPAFKDEVKPAPIKKEEEKEKEEPVTINQKISAQLGATGAISEQLNTQQVSDLKQAINLNDKMLYVRDLFNGYSLAYSEAVDILNRFTKFEEAEQFLTKNYAVKNSWERKPETVDKFYILLKRRYA